MTVRKGPIHACMKWLRFTTTWVGPGSSPPKSLNIRSKVGMILTSIRTTTPTATTNTVVGYTMAPFTLRRSASAFSR